MSFDIPKLSFSIIVSGLISYGFYSFNTLDQNTIIAIISFVTLSLCLTFLTAVSFNDSRDKVNLRVISMIFLVLFFVSLLVVNNFLFSTTSLIIIFGLSVSIYLYLIYSLSR